MKAVVELNPGARVAAAELIALCKERLGGVRAPKSIDFVDSLPRSSNGKVLKNDIRERYWTGHARREPRPYAAFKSASRGIGSLVWSGRPRRGAISIRRVRSRERGLLDMPETIGEWPRGRIWRVCVATALAGGVAAAAGCGAGPFRDGGSAGPAATAATPARTVYRTPADPCAAAAPGLAKRYGMRDATRRSTTQYAMDPATPQDPLVNFDVIACEWTVANPGTGPRGRPNQMIVRIEYAVIDPERDGADAVARVVHTRAYEGLRQRKEVTVVREGTPTVPADDGYYAYARRRSVTGASGEVEAVIRLANAVVTVRFSGADLELDPALPRGAQLVTTPVAESRLQPAVESLLPEAIGILR